MRIQYRMTMAKKTASQQILDDIFDSFSKDSDSTVRDSIDSTTSTTVFSSTELLDEDRKEEELIGLSLSVGFELVYGYDYNKDKIPKSERTIMANNKELLRLIGEQKIFHLNGLVNTFGDAVNNITKFRVRNVAALLVKRRLLNIANWKGKAKKTYGLIIYTTQDCSVVDVENYMRHAMAIDDLRYGYELKNKKPDKKSPEEIVKHNKEVSELTKMEKLLEGHLDICACDHAKGEHYNHECVVKDCPCLEYTKKVKKS